MLLSLNQGQNELRFIFGEMGRGAVLNTGWTIIIFHLGCRVERECESSFHLLVCFLVGRMLWKWIGAINFVGEFTKLSDQI